MKVSPKWKSFKIKSQEIWDVQLSSDDSLGHEIVNTRPCIVIKCNDLVDIVTIIPLTKTLNLKDLPYTYVINPNDNNGLENKSVVLIYQIRSLSKERFLRLRGRLKIDEYKIILKFLFDFFDFTKLKVA